MMEAFRMELPPDLEEWEKLKENIIAFCKQHGISDHLSLSLQLVSEEWFINIIVHGYNSEMYDVNNKPAIQFSIGINDSDEVVLQFTDQAPAFNPLQHEMPDISLTAEERSIGGLGIYLIRSKMDHCSYRRLDNSNELTLRKKLK